MRTNHRIVEVFTKEATGGQFNVNSTLEDFHKVDMDKVHTVTMHIPKSSFRACLNFKQALNAMTINY